ncbi:probable 28S ribosomal protein S16, mitochondrial isoform X2 [Nasonia vitripennis]|uniref:Small ribosomal subunit protein bS16m n=1 Tax=Nasonia vitripennis TaxID=7425 RepID=A0A7M7Q6V8_NASVI|nr:probable 28S ribosomal protein S16, mitochondrial isoform X2 [Nasonia vitripennis]
MTLANGNLLNESHLSIHHFPTVQQYSELSNIKTKSNQKKPPIEQLGSFDECQNIFNEKLVTVNYERIQYWIGQGASVSRPLLEILGISGLLPIHPRTYITAWRKR